MLFPHDPAQRNGVYALAALEQMEFEGRGFADSSVLMRRTFACGAFDFPHAMMAGVFAAKILDAMLNMDRGEARERQFIAMNGHEPKCKMENGRASSCRSVGHEYLSNLRPRSEASPTSGRERGGRKGRGPCRGSRS